MYVEHQWKYYSEYSMYRVLSALQTNGEQAQNEASLERVIISRKFMETYIILQL